MKMGARIVASHRQHGREHGLARIARGPHDVVESDHDIRDGAAQQDDLHEVAGIRHGRFTGSEEKQNRFQEDERQSPVEHGIDDTENRHIAQDVFGPFLVFLSQADGGECSTSHTHQRTERHQQVHEREGDGQSRDGQCPHTVSDEDTVDDVVERGQRHADDGRDGIFQQQFPDGSLSQDMRIVLFHAKFVYFNSQS